ncbi:hypothetical protein KXD96_19540 [Mycobacterium sp. SMC-2]|uniref:hypothetical protein n=1 Tax=Mycobacterium sp. SMC-2 TaxID=2857058 RepID=UPI0021B4828F|nr:hypothetical protein [Mycobacterium sp. SMC-2]UXA05141.1 hypothetical protein KXD96_19540 [Mycobacterium sp. SMC-2]
MTIAAMKDLLRGRVFGALWLALAMLSAIAIAAPAIGRADPNCAEGFAWSVDLHQCVPEVPAVNGPGGPAGPSSPGGVAQSSEPGAPEVPGEPGLPGYSGP